MTLPIRRRLLVTGAAGGVGRCCARLLGATHDLVLTDASPALVALAAELRAEGYVLAGIHSGDLGNPELLSAIAADLGEAPFAAIHAAGLSPALADWDAIIQVNVVASERLLVALEPILVPGSVAVMVASAAGYRVPFDAEVQALLDDPLHPDLLPRLDTLLGARDAVMDKASTAYALSKQAVHRMCELRAPRWGQAGARIVTVSPGLMETDMGRKEMARSAGAMAMRGANPIGRTGTAMDVALAARFLTSEDAAFITGCDLRIDGGVIAASRR